ncbi:MAG: hypothetical protein ABEJ40_09970 [Haloarculaceae archaeon]
MTQTPTPRETAWGKTLTEANRMAAELRDEGWNVVAVRAGHVAPVAPAQGNSDRFGLVYVAPDGVAEDLLDAVEGGSFDRSDAFRNRVGSDLFLVTRVVDSDARRVVVLVGAVDLGRADPLLDAVRERGTVHSHVELLDGTHLASLRHDDPSILLPSVA